MIVIVSWLLLGRGLGCNCDAIEVAMEASRFEAQRDRVCSWTEATDNGGAVLTKMVTESG